MNVSLIEACDYNEKGKNENEKLKQTVLAIQSFLLNCLPIMLSSKIRISARF